MTFPSDKFKELVRRIQAGEDPVKSICEVYGFFDYEDIANEGSLPRMVDALYENYNLDNLNKIYINNYKIDKELEGNFLLKGHRKFKKYYKKNNINDILDNISFK